MKKYLSFLLLFFPVINSYAQEDTTITAEEILGMSIEELLEEPITGASIYKQNLKTVPGNVLVITSEDINNRGYSDLSDVLKDAFGFDITNNARGFGEYYRIQGIEGNDRFLVLIDGHKINPPSGTFLSIGNSISIRYAKRIEIIYGPVSVIYGSEALSGVINIVTDNSTGGKPFKGYTRLSYGSANTFDEEVGFNYSGKNGFKLDLHARFYLSDGPDLVDRDTVYNIIKQYTPPQTNKFEQPIIDHTIMANASYKKLNARYLRQSFNEGNALGTNPKGNIFNKEYKWSSVYEHLVLGYHNEFNATSKLKIDIDLNHFRIDPETQFYKWQTSYKTDTAFSQYMTGDDKSIRLNISYNKQINNNLIFLAGVESEYISSIPPYANDQVIGKSVKYEGANAELIKRELTVDEIRNGGFLQFSYTLFDKLTPVVGIRYSFSSVHDPAITPRMGLIYNLSKRLNLKYIYGTGFQAPSMFYKYEQWGAASAVMLSEQEVQQIEPGWTLKNQKIETHDISLQWRIGEKLLVSASVFAHRLSDLIERATFSDSVYNKYYSTQNNSVYTLGIRNENIGSQYIYGSNIYAKFNFSQYASAYFAYSYLDGSSKINEVETDIAGIANHKFWLGLNLHGLIKNLTISIRYQQTGEINNKNKALYPSGKQSGYSNLDLYADYRNIFNRLTVFLNVTNVLNQDYQHPGLYQQSGGYLPTIHQNKLLLKAGIELNF